MTERKIIHIDMDAFFAAVEQRDNPELRGKPVAVGFDGPRGVVSTASYEARKYGVHSAQSIAQAKQRCPNLIIVPCRHDYYAKISHQIHQIFQEYTDLIEPISIDEAFLDVTQNKKGIELAVDIAKEIKTRIKEATGLTDYYYDMAYDGKWEEGLRFMADAYAKVSSVRDGIEAERNLQGFFMAYLNLNDYYITAPELELNHGYCDFFLLPDLTHYASQHSYILELKVLSKKDFSAIVEGEFTEDGKPMTKAEKQWREAVDQIHRYAEAPRVEALRQGTKLHLIIMQFEGWELKRMEEV